MVLKILHIFETKLKTEILRLTTSTSRPQYCFQPMVLKILFIVEIKNGKKEIHHLTTFTSQHTVV
jgi:hypothetical protein